MIIHVLSAFFIITSYYFFFSSIFFMKISSLLFFSFMISIIQCQPPGETKEDANNLKVTALSNIKQTGRISSNHYSDFVIDSMGNSYIASFYTKSRTDHIYIAKVSESGEILWEIDKENVGRATAISIDSEEHIWVTGVFTGRLNFGTKNYSNPSPSAPFLAKFDKDGICKILISGRGAALPVNCHVNKNGLVLINGEAGMNLQFGKVIYTKEKANNSFFAAFDTNGACQWIKHGNMNVHQITSDKEGAFFLTGSFFDTLRYDTILGLTSDNYDSDAFLLKMDSNGKGQWLQQIKNPGSLRKGYRSQESAGELVFNSKNEIAVAVVLEMPNDQQFVLSESTWLYEYWLYKYDHKGNFISKNILVKNLSDGGIVTLVNDDEDNYYLTCTAKEKCDIAGQPYLFENRRQPIILKFDKQLQFQNIVYSNQTMDGSFRVARLNKKGSFYTGHFRKKMQLGDFEIEAAAGMGHGLFLLKMEY